MSENMIKKNNQMWNLNQKELDIFWGTILGTFGLVVLILFLIFIVSGHSCDSKTEISNTSFNGIIIRKYIKEYNHNITTIELSERYNKKEEYSLSFYNPNFIESIKVGDTLYSKKGSPYITVKRKDTMMTFIKYYEPE